MHLKVPFEILKIEGQRFAVPMDKIDDGFSGVMKLNSTAADIIEMLKEEIDEESIVERMSQHYDISKDILAADVHHIVMLLRTKGCLS